MLGSDEMPTGKRLMLSRWRECSTLEVLEQYKRPSVCRTADLHFSNTKMLV